ncbi:hypothetical protein M409DRAFT_54786 [Zasmidium cellare ATCC 36951]|uniref:Uncharacterized protein n=1 Tax=Zasmidium cellare ATCC 36951 TaxID=1080233 RepID=A0A6A6CLX2_ZASCE|nr:uncharacterized protein M409DRAFT_54786 [Zasmidium cellare ATCC 36951]KAF2166436.1 hypothetical protein M409DRAFT_54786 [Zasmidium cellare ATCC 36951]
MATITPPTFPHWLHEPARVLLLRCNNIRPANEPTFTTLELQLFLTAANLTTLLLGKVPDSTTWTAPSVVLAADETRLLSDIALEVLNNAIEERVLPDLQFLDHASPKPTMEIAQPGKLVVKAFLSTATPKLDEEVVVHADEAFEETRWVAVVDENPTGNHLERYLAPGKMAITRDLLGRFAGKFQQVVQGGGPALRELVSNTIKTTIKLQQLDLGGENITHTLIVWDRNVPDVLYLIKANAELMAQVRQQELREVQSIVAVPGGEYAVKRYWVAGALVGGSILLDGRYCSRGMVGEGWRVAIEWIQVTKGMRLGGVGVPGQAQAQAQG